MNAASQSIHSHNPELVIGQHQEVDAWLKDNNLPPKPDEVNGKGTAQVWTVVTPQGASLAIVSAQDNASLKSLIRPLPHYGRQSYIVFDGWQAMDRSVWPLRMQRVAVD